MNDMTAAHLRSAFGGESMAHMRYKIWGAKAADDGFANVGRLFEAISLAEQVHASNHFAAMSDIAGDFLVPSGAGFGLGSTSDNLQGAINGELFEVEQMYPVYMESARFQTEKNAVLSFHYALEAEKIHAEMYKAAKMSVDAGEDIQIGTIHICKTCGYTHEGDAPGKCPICGALEDEFVAFA